MTWTAAVQGLDANLRLVHRFGCRCKTDRQMPPSPKCAVLRREVFVEAENIQRGE